MSPSTPLPAAPAAPIRLLLVDDDDRLRERLLRAFAARGIEARGAGDADEGLRVAEKFEPALAVVDLRMPGRSGLDLLPELLDRVPGIRVLVLTGYGSIATAISSVRQGAVDYLSKPADADQILSALGVDPSGPAPETAAEDDGSAPSLARVEWEHIQRVLTDCDGNVSKAARVLGLHRRTLQRKLMTNPPRR